MNDAQPDPTADDRRDQEKDEVPADADPRRLYTDPEFDDEEPPPPDPAERGDNP